MVYNNLSRPHTTRLNGAKYYVTFSCDITKQSKTILLKEKNGIFLIFEEYCLGNERSNKKIQ